MRRIWYHTIMRRVTILGIPTNLGAENSGTEHGPKAFRSQNIGGKLTHGGFTVIDAGDIKCRPRTHMRVGAPHLKYLEEIISLSEKSAKCTFDVIKKGERLVALGGDHSLCLGVISGASAAFDGRLGLIYLDAHGDMNTARTTFTGNIHGMPLSALMGFGDRRLVNICTPKTKISKHHMLHVGGSDFDPGEIALIEKESISCFTMIDLLSGGLAPLFARINKLSQKIKNIWVSLDLDVIDEHYAPGVGMPNKGGLTYREIVAITGYIGTHCRVVGADINEHNPLTDSHGKTAELGIELITNLLGGRYSRYTNYIEQNKIKSQLSAV